ncbi:hypothetical protein [Caudoviricetes sp.]|nr:hypothetical protein [Caudoviricetes sp.]
MMDYPLGILSLACLIITGGLATWGVFSKHFDDSLTQCVGLSVVAIACILRIPEKIAHPYTPPEILMAQIGLCIYGIGTAMKIIRRSRRATHHDRRGMGAGF